MVQGALRLLLLCILGLQVSFGDSWGTREALSFARYYLPPPPPPPLSPPPPPPPQSSAAEVLAALEATYGEILVKWEQQFARWSALKTLTAGHGLPPLLPPPLLPPPPLPEFSAALRSQHSKAQLEWELQAAASQDAPASSRKLLQRLNFENPNYHPSPPPPIPPPPPSPPPSPPSPPTPSGQGTVPWQGTLQGITSALGELLLSCCEAMLVRTEPYMHCLMPKLNSLQGYPSHAHQSHARLHVDCNVNFVLRSWLPVQALS